MEINSNTPKPNLSSSPAGLGNAQRPGEYLRQIRLSQRKELAEVAQELKIPEKQLQALEKDDYKALPEAPFIKGYYRAYAKYLHADATPLIQRFDEIYSNDTGLPPNHALKDSPIKTMGKLTSRSRRGSWRKWIRRLLWLAVIVAFLAMLWTLFNNWREQREVREVDTVSDQNSVEVLPMTTGTLSASGDQLVLEFVRPTSVRIRDSLGKVLAQGRQSETLTLQGQAPFSIRLDDAGAVKLKLNNESIGLSSYTSASGSADFRLSP